MKFKVEGDMPPGGQVTVILPDEYEEEEPDKEKEPVIPEEKKSKVVAIGGRK